MCACMPTTCMYGTHGGQKRTVDTLRIELLKLVVSHEVGARKHFWVLRKNKCSYSLRHPSRPTMARILLKSSIWETEIYDFHF